MPTTVEAPRPVEPPPPPPQIPPPVPTSPRPQSVQPPPLPLESFGFVGFWRRAAAYAIDLLINLPIAFLVGGIVVVMVGEDSAAPAVWIVSTVIWWLYFALLECGTKQSTWGKRAMGIKVTDEQGNRIGFGRATGRHFAKIISGVILGIGYLMVAFTKKRQGLHDYMANTYVVDREVPTGEVPAGVGKPLSGGGLAAVIVGAILLMVIPSIGIVAAIAIPQYQDFLSRSRVADVYYQANTAARMVGDYYEREQDVPKDLASLGYQSPNTMTITVDGSNGVITARHNVDKFTLKLIPTESNGKVVWRCDSGGLPRSKTGGICNAE